MCEVERCSDSAEEWVPPAGDSAFCGWLMACMHAQHRGAGGGGGEQSWGSEEYTVLRCLLWVSPHPGPLCSWVAPQCPPSMAVPPCRFPMVLLPTARGRGSGVWPGASLPRQVNGAEPKKWCRPGSDLLTPLPSGPCGACSLLSSPPVSLPVELRRFPLLYVGFDLKRLTCVLVPVALCVFVTFLLCPGPARASECFRPNRCSLRQYLALNTERFVFRFTIQKPYS